METNPLLARRVIPRKERLQKALLTLVLTIAIAAGAWFVTGASLASGIPHLAALGAVAVTGTSLAGYFWFKKHETATTKEDKRSVRHRIDDDRQGRSWISRLGYNIRRFLAGIVVVAGVLIALIGLGVLAVQVFGYLKTGDWKSMSTLSVASPYFPWLYDPQSWFGLNAIVRDMLGLLPLSVALIILGWLVAGIGSALRQRA